MEHAEIYENPKNHHLKVIVFLVFAIVLALLIVPSFYNDFSFTGFTISNITANSSIKITADLTIPALKVNGNFENVEINSNSGGLYVEDEKFRLMDELEKAHPKVFDIFLQVLEDGRLTDSQGHTADFKNTIIIMTSNIDVSEFLPSVLPRSDLNRNSRLQAEKGSPAGERSDLNEKVNRTDLMKALSHHLRPEFLNRIDDIILMNQLNLAAIKQIARLQLTQVQNRLKEKGVNLEVPDATLEKLANLGNVAEFGARPLKRLIQNHIEEPIAELIIAGKLKSGDKIEWGAEKIK